MKLNTFQQKLNQESPYDFSGLKAIFLNCTLKRSPELSHTEGLIRMSQAIMEANGIATIMTWNLMHQAHLLQKHGIPAYGNRRTAWDNRKSKDHPNPKYR